MESSSLSHPAKTVIKLQLKKEGPLITLSSSFDSGNMAAAEVGLNSSIVITPANDCATSDNPSHSKGWFYFSVSGVSPHTKVKFIIKKMQQLSTQVAIHSRRSSSASTLSQFSKLGTRGGSGWSRRWYL
jgi:hypothetical protein